MVGLGRMGGNMARRLARDGHACVGWAPHPPAGGQLEAEGIQIAPDLAGLVGRLAPPRTVWLMVPAGAVEGLLQPLAALLEPGDLLVDGGNSHYVEAIRRAAALSAQGIAFVDVGVSGGVWGLERGYCLMIGGPAGPVARLTPIFRSLAPGRDAAPPTAGRPADRGTADEGFLHCGPSGAGHFVKMVHNGIEYGLMAALAEGLNLMAHAGVGRGEAAGHGQTSAPDHPAHLAYDLPIGEVVELWRRGSVVSSWLLDLAARAMLDDPSLADFSGHVSDSGEGRWALMAAVESRTPAPVLGAALFQRFASRGEDDYARRVLSALRYQFGGHQEPATQ
jgi:6-phosphogluconate dehydrogenase